MLERINESALKIHRVPGGRGPAGTSAGITGRNTGTVSRPVVSGLVESDLACVVSPGGRGGRGRVVSAWAERPVGRIRRAETIQARLTPGRRPGVPRTPEHRSRVTRAPRPFAAGTP